MEISTHLRGVRHHIGEKNPARAQRPFFEQLEPRILLSGDSLLYAAVPDPLPDALPNSTQQIVQCAESLESSEQVEQETGQELDVSDQLEICQPLLTLSVNDLVDPIQAGEDLGEIVND